MLLASKAKLTVSISLSPSLQDHDGFTALYLCVWNPLNWEADGQTALTFSLALQGADVSMADHQGTLPLIHAWKSSVLVKILVQHGASVSGKVNGGEFSFLELAALEGKWDLVTVILKTGVRFQIQRRSGDTNSNTIWSQRKYVGTYRRLREESNSILTLKELSRIRIRNLVIGRKVPLFQGVQTLPLPDQVQDYLCMREIWDWTTQQLVMTGCCHISASASIGKSQSVVDFKPCRRYSV